MAGWFNKIKNDQSQIPNMLKYMDNILTQSTKDIKITGVLEKQSAQLPGLVEYYFNFLQELEACLEFLEIERGRCWSKHHRKYVEGYQRSLSNTEASRFADGEPEVISYNHLINEVALMRNKFQGVMKALETKGFQVNNIIKLRLVGLDDASV